MQDELREDHRSDDQLLKLGWHGDEDAFLALYRRHSGQVYRFALHMSGSKSVAEEVLQETFVILLERKEHFDPQRGTLGAFLIGVARNQVRRQRLLASRGYAGELDKLEAHCGTGYDESDLELLREAIQALPENYRAVTVLCELEEMSYADAAQRLGCAIGTVRSRLHRAKALLQAKLGRRKKCSATAKG